MYKFDYVLREFHENNWINAHSNLNFWQRFQEKGKISNIPDWSWSTSYVPESMLGTCYLLLIESVTQILRGYYQYHSFEGEEVDVQRK